MVGILNKKRLPGQVKLQPGPALLDVDHGAPPLRPMPHDPQLQGKPDPGKLVAGQSPRLQSRVHASGLCHLGNTSSHSSSKVKQH